MHVKRQEKSTILLKNRACGAVFRLKCTLYPTFRLITYSIDTGNAGEVEQSTIDVRLLLPAGLVADTISGGGIQNPTSGDIEWQIETLSAGGLVRREVDVRVANDAADGTILGARIEVREDGGLEVDAFSEETVTVDSSLALTGQVGPNPVSSEGFLDYEMMVSNLSLDPVENVKVLFRTPSGITFHESENAFPNADRASCGGSSGGSQENCTAGEEAVWSLGTITAGENRIIELNVGVVADLASGTLITVPVVIRGNGGDNISLERTVQVISS